MTDTLSRLKRVSLELDQKWIVEELDPPAMPGPVETPSGEIGFAQVVPHENGVDWCWTQINGVLARMNDPRSTPQDHEGQAVAWKYPDLSVQVYPIFEELRTGEKQYVELEFEAETGGFVNRWKVVYARMEARDGTFLCVNALVWKVGSRVA